jgi:two-component system, chemotaxis family, sensor kinase CheA
MGAGLLDGRGLPEVYAAAARTLGVALAVVTRMARSLVGAVRTRVERVRNRPVRPPSRLALATRRAWAALLAYLVLPPDVTPVERQYLAGVHRVGLVFLALHVPVLALAAAVNGTGVLAALGLTTALAASPWAVGRVTHHPRHVSWAFGMATVLAGALAVYFGNGLWTVESQFYFFVTLALLAALADPVLVLVAGALVIAHQAGLAAVAPDRLFNPALLAGPLAQVAFTLVESAAAIFVARTLHDTLRGLEKVVVERTAERDERAAQVRFLHDTAGQGLVSADADGVIAGDCSRALAEWLGPSASGAKVWDLFKAHDPDFARWLQLGWAALAEDVLPSPLALQQLPSRLVANGRTLEVRYQRQRERFLVSVTDLSDRVASERIAGVHRETVAIFEQILRDRNGFLQFAHDMDQQVHLLCAQPPVLRPMEIARTLHTMRSNAWLFGVTSVAVACEALEGRTEDRGEPPTRADLEELASCWRQVSESVAVLVGDAPREDLDVTTKDYERLVTAVEERRPLDEIGRMLASWRLEPVRRRFEHLGQQALSLAERQGVTDVRVRVDDGGVRLDRQRAAPFWSALVHVVRNAIDHGLRDATGRRELILRARYQQGDQVKIEVADSGFGIRWERVAEAAATRGMLRSTRQHLVDALFTDRLSTRDEASDVSGHGVGLSAVRVTCDQLGIDRQVHSEPGEGAHFLFVLPSSFTEAEAGEEQLAQAS